MYTAHVLPQPTVGREASRTDGARVGLLASVLPLVCRQGGFVLEALLAVAALVLWVIVHQHVHLERGGVDAALAAFLALHFPVSVFSDVITLSRVNQ